MHGKNFYDWLIIMWGCVIKANDCSKSFNLTRSWMIIIFSTVQYFSTLWWVICPLCMIWRCEKWSPQHGATKMFVWSLVNGFLELALTTVVILDWETSNQNKQKVEKFKISLNLWYPSIYQPLKFWKSVLFFQCSTWLQNCLDYIKVVSKKLF